MLLYKVKYFRNLMPDDYFVLSYPIATVKASLEYL